MIARSRHRALTPLALALALWIALPSFEWCPIDWAACRTACATGPTAGGASLVDPCASAADAAACARVDGRRTVAGGCECACAPSAAACAASGSGCVRPCDCEPDPPPFGDHVWCLHPPANGLVVRPLELPAPIAAPLLANLVPTCDLQPRAGASVGIDAPRARSPVLAAPHAPPLARAPPPRLIAPPVRGSRAWSHHDADVTHMNPGVRS